MQSGFNGMNPAQDQLIYMPKSRTPVFVFGKIFANKISFQLTGEPWFAPFYPA